MYSTTGNIIFEINAELKSTINSPFYNLHKIAKKVDFGNEKVPFPSFSTKILLLSLTQFFSGQKKRVKGGVPVLKLKIHSEPISLSRVAC